MPISYAFPSVPLTTFDRPQDVVLQAQCCSGFDNVQEAYIRHGIAANVVTCTALLTPEQCSEVYVQSYVRGWACAAVCGGINEYAGVVLGAASLMPCCSEQACLFCFAFPVCHTSLVF